jgi:hypothetical protein
MGGRTSELIKKGRIGLGFIPIPTRLDLYFIPFIIYSGKQGSLSREINDKRPQIERSAMLDIFSLVILLV